MKIKTLIVIALLAINSSVWAEANHHVMTQEKQEAMTPQTVFEHLIEGNQRFVDGKPKNRNFLAQVSKTASTQHPVAVILGCMDSRMPLEIVFDQGIGDIFALRVAGNVQNNDILGSMEYGTQVVGAKLIAVIGHTNCGAIRGACDKVKLGHLSELLHKIQPSLVQASKELGANNCANSSFIDQIAKDNVLLVVKQIQENSPIIRKLIKEGKIGIIGGIQDLSTGKVTFFDGKNIATDAH